MTNAECVSCRRPKATLVCGLCESDICKECSQFLDADSFSFMRKIPEDLSHTHYCPYCYDEKVAPALEAYAETMERAKEVFVFFKTQKKAPPIWKKSTEIVRVTDCPDRDETILRLAFVAVEQDFNALIETDVVSEKVRNAGYQKTSWKGSAIPALVDAEKVERDFRK